jgi:hypothetical protein
MVRCMFVERFVWLIPLTNETLALKLETPTLVLGVLFLWGLIVVNDRKFKAITGL